MDMSQSVDNAGLALFHVGSLMQFGAANPVDIVSNRLQTELPGTYQFVSRPSAGDTTRVMIGGNNGRKIMYLGGVTFAAQGTALIDGYNNGAGPTNTNGFNPWLMTAADRAITTLFTPGFTLPENLDIVGYSAGGATALHVMDKLKVQRPTLKCRVISFGAPRAGNEAFRVRTSTRPIARWMTDADPIPLLPPRVEDSPALVVAIGPLTALRYGSFVHPAGGISIDSQGRCSAAILPPLATVNPISSLASWFFVIEGEPNNPHALTTYFGRLESTVRLATTIAQLNEPRAHGEPPEQDTRRKLTRREREIVDRIAHLGLKQNQTEPRVPATVLFKAQRIGRLWAVTFGGRIICWAPIGKRARHLARAGNDFLRSLPKQALVDPDSLASGLDEFMAAAVNPTSGFVPTISVGLDQ